MELPDHPAAIEAVLFDFFGTLVTYEPDRSQLAYSATFELLGSWGWRGPYEHFVADWDAASSELEAASAETMREFDMEDAARAFGDRVDLKLSAPRCRTLGASFVEEWQLHVQPVPGAAEMIRSLSTWARVGLVSNTHDQAMVPRMLEAMGVADLVDPVVLSVVHGWKKPHPSIYTAALDALSLPGHQVVFVGDNYEADFVGPEAAGIASYLIDSGSDRELPVGRRLSNVLDIEALLDD